VTHVLVLYTFDPHLGELSSSRRSPVDSGGTGSSGNKALAGFCIVGALGGGCRGAIGPARSPRARRLGSKSENSPKISCPIREPSDRPSVEQEDPFETTRRPHKTRSLDLGAAAARGRLRRAGRPRRHRGDAYDQHEHSGTVSWRHRVEEASTPEVREVPPRSPFVCRLASLAASHARARRAASPEVAASFASHAAHLTCDHPHQRLRLWVREARGSLIRSCR
jgi:hypothetical protein